MFINIDPNPAPKTQCLTHMLSPLRGERFGLAVWSGSDQAESLTRKECMAGKTQVEQNLTTSQPVHPQILYWTVKTLPVINAVGLTEMLKRLLERRMMSEATMIPGGRVAIVNGAMRRLRCSTWARVYAFGHEITTFDTKFCVPRGPIWLRLDRVSYTHIKHQGYRI
jgi:hypothetical protein